MTQAKQVLLTQGLRRKSEGICSMMKNSANVRRQI
jgi:hypothetical protein